MNDLFEKALAAEGVSGTLADLARSIYMQESSGGKNTRTSNRGARGGMQIIPSTFRSVAEPDWNIDDPLHNARAGIRYIQQMHEVAKGDPRLTAIGYYGGPGGIQKARRGTAVSDPKNPHAPNTFGYADQVLARMPTRVAKAPPVAEVETPAVQENPWFAFDRALAGDPRGMERHLAGYGQPAPAPAPSQTPPTQLADATSATPEVPAAPEEPFAQPRAMRGMDGQALLAGLMQMLQTSTAAREAPINPFRAMRARL